MTKKKILITGGSGLVGKNTIDILRKDSNFKIYSLSRTPYRDKDIINIKADARNFDTSKIEADFDYIIHLLALSHEKYCQNLDDAIEVNVNFTKKILDFALTQKNLKKFIYLSSTILYDTNTPSPLTEESPTNFFNGNYQFTKGVAENYVKYFQEKFKLPIIIFRLSNIYGPNHKIEDSPFLIPSKISQALSENRIEVFSLSPKKDWIYSRDAAQGIVKALDSDFNGTLNLASGEGLSVEEIIKIIADTLNVEYKSIKAEPKEQTNFYCDITKIKKILNWEPSTSLEEGIKKTIEYIKKNKI